MTGSDDDSPAVVSYRLGRVETEVSTVREMLATYLGQLDVKFVPREVYEAEKRAADERLDKTAVWVADIAASLERTSRNMVDKSTARWVVGTLIALIVGLGAILPAFFAH